MCNNCEEQSVVVVVFHIRERRRDGDECAPYRLHTKIHAAHSTRQRIL